MEKEVSVGFQQVPKNTEDLDVEAKEEWLGAVIAQLQCDNDDLHAIVDPCTPAKEFAKSKITIYYFAK